MQKVVVAGGAGFIGSHLVRSLLDKGFSVIVIDNFITGDVKNVADFADNDRFRLIEFDITKPFEDISRDLQGTSFIYHLASPASPNKASPKSYINHPLETLNVNSVGTHNMLELARVNNARFLFASTSEVYGDPHISPQTETYFGNVNPNGVRSVYDEGKRFGEAITMAYVRKFDLDARIVRIFNTYGPFMQPDDGRVVSNFITQILSGKPLTIYGDGSQTRSFCYVSDMVAGLFKAMNTDQASGQVINLGNPDERTIADIAKLIMSISGINGTITKDVLPEDDPKKRHPDVTRAKNILGWEAVVPLEEGLEKTIAYFKKSI